MQTFASLENEGNTFPPRIVNPERGSSVGWANRVWWDSVIVQVTGLAVGRNILAKESIAPLDGWDSAENLDLDMT